MLVFILILNKYIGVIFMITERISEILDLKGITKYRFCKDLGLSNGFLDKPREITTDKYANILEYLPDISPEWLLTGKGSMLKSEDRPISFDTKNQDEKRDDNISIPREVFDQITRLTETILSQQKTIEKLADRQKGGAVGDAKGVVPKQSLG
ncbi:MAG: hypothetical protein LBQ74_13215 [Prevotella sp.]|jgi:hypothetical protein|nr:hypothetical protein [Prevotella sp.]